MKCQYFRNLEQCRSKWTDRFDPLINVNSFTVEEDNLLLNFINNSRNRTVNLAEMLQYFNNRTDRQLATRWNILENNQIILKQKMKKMKRKLTIPPNFNRKGHTNINEDDFDMILEVG